MPLIALLPGDGIGPEVIAEAVRVLEALDCDFTFETEAVGGAGYIAAGHPLPPSALALAKRADAILFGAVGDPDFDGLERTMRPERAIRDLRRELKLFANLRPAKLFPGLEDQSHLRPEIARAIDLMIVRDISGEIDHEHSSNGHSARGLREACDRLHYDEAQVARIARTAFETSLRRGAKLASVDKANLLETGQLWRDVVNEVARDYPEVDYAHMHAEAAAMQLVNDPGEFDTILTPNIIGDILTSLASMCVGSIGMLPSASLDEDGKGLFEPIHGSAPDIAGEGEANPCAAILSAAMMLSYSFGMSERAQQIVAAVTRALDDGARTRDIGGTLTTGEMGAAVIERLG